MKEREKQMRSGELIKKIFQRKITNSTADREENQPVSVQASPTAVTSTTVSHPAKATTIREIRSELLSQIRNGRLVIPEGMSEIPDSLFDGFILGKESCINRLVSIVVPGTVKSIGERAFGDCKNLEEVILSEGIKRIESNAFTGCEKLKRLQLSASIKEIDGRAFIHCGIDEPVFSADGKVLIYYPPEWENSEYTVPDGVEKIVWGAFWKAKNLTKIILPQSLKLICNSAFIECGFTEIAIPKDTEIEECAFSSFKHGIRIICENKQNALEEKMQYCRVNGIPFLARQQMELPQTPYWKEDEFQLLAKQCATGDIKAMERMGDYFLGKANGEDNSIFYQCAAQFWRTRAYRYGSRDAKMYLLAWCEKQANARMVSPALDEKLRGTADGELLNALGFPFFESGREYSLSGVDKDGVVEVSSWESTEGPDEDGFGMEECYDWWYLNEYLMLPETVGYIHSYSHNDKRCNEKKFRALHDQVAASKKS